MVYLMPQLSMRLVRLFIGMEGPGIIVRFIVIVCYILMRPVAVFRER